MNTRNCVRAFWVSRLEGTRGTGSLSLQCKNGKNRDQLIKVKS